LTDVTELEARSYIEEPAIRGGNWREASSSTLCNRRFAVRTIFRGARRLGLASHDPTLDLVLPARTAREVRALFGDEQEQCQLAAYYTSRSSRLAAAWALGQAGGTNTELVAAVPADVDLEGRRVWLHGTTQIVPRWAPLSEWGVEQLGRHLARRSSGDLPLLAGKGSKKSTARVALSQAIADVLLRAGLRGEPDLKPKSLRMWFAAEVLEASGSIVEVANQLGLRSLDAAAWWAGLNWQEVER
jgi:integrase/recombinase XerC